MSVEEPPPYIFAPYKDPPPYTVYKDRHEAPPPAYELVPLNSSERQAEEVGDEPLTDPIQQQTVVLLDNVDGEEWAQNIDQ